MAIPDVLVTLRFRLVVEILFAKLWSTIKISSCHIFLSSFNQDNVRSWSRTSKGKVERNSPKKQHYVQIETVSVDTLHGGSDPCTRNRATSGVKTGRTKNLGKLLTPPCTRETPVTSIESSRWKISRAFCPLPVPNQGSNANGSRESDAYLKSDILGSTRLSKIMLNWKLVSTRLR